MSVNWMMPSRGHGNGYVTSKHGVTGAITSGGNSRQMTFSIRQDVMAAMRWVLGDRVLVGYDPAQNTIVIRRDARGHKLTQPGKKGGVNDGKCMLAVVKVTWRDTIPEGIFPFHVPLSDCVIDGIDLHFQPKGDQS